MDSGIELEQVNNEVMRKIGRNMLLFQQLEGMLKYLIANGSFSGTSETLVSNREKQVSQIKTKTMGQLVGEFFESAYSTEYEHHSSAPVDGIHISFKFHTECDEEEYESRKNALADIVAERNDLIHHLLPKYDPSSLESLQELDEQLQQQRDKLLPELEFLKSLISSFKDTQKKFAAIMASEDIKSFFMEGILPGESRLDWLLRKVAALAARDDGWAPLSYAGNLINSYEPEALNKVLDELGVSKIKNLKRLVESSGKFDLYEEPIEQGTRWLFRPKETANNVQIESPDTETLKSVSMMTSNTITKD